MRAISPARNPHARMVPTVQMKIVRLTMTHPRSTYFFFFFPLSPGPARSQLCCVSFNCLEVVDSAARSRSMSRLLSSSVAESAWISRGPPHGSRPYMLIFDSEIKSNAYPKCMRKWASEGKRLLGAASDSAILVTEKREREREREREGFNCLRKSDVLMCASGICISGAGDGDIGH